MSAKITNFNNELHANISETIHSIPLFSEFQNDELIKLLTSIEAKVVNLNRGEVIFNENDYFDELCILISGEILLSKIDTSGNRSIIDIINSPKIFAEVFSFTTKKISPVTAEANKDSVIITINTDKLSSIEKHIDDESIINLKYSILNNLLHIFADKNLILLSKIEITSKRNLREKILSFLEQHKARQGTQIFEIPYSRQEMADFLGVDRSALSRELSKLKEENKIDYHKNNFKII